MSENYKYGFVTDIENEAFEKGLNEDIIRRASAWYMNKMRLSVKGIKKNVKRNQIEILEMNNTISEMENSLSRI